MHSYQTLGTEQISDDYKNKTLLHVSIFPFLHNFTYSAISSFLQNLAVRTKKQKDKHYSKKTDQKVVLKKSQEEYLLPNNRK